MKTLTHQRERFVVVSRDDNIYEGFPDLVMLESGRLLCLYKQADAHAPTWSNIALIESCDNGRTWGNRRIVHTAQTPSEHNHLCWNKPRLCLLRDGRLVIVADQCSTKTFLFWSEDDGQTWSSPRETAIVGVCPDRIVELDDGSMLIAAHEADPNCPGRLPLMVRCVVYRSIDCGVTWQRFSAISGGDGGIYSPCEPALIQLADGTLVGYFRGHCGLCPSSRKSYSHDRGKTWTVPIETGIFGQTISPGFLHDGRILLTYGNSSGNPSIYAWCGDGNEEPGYQPSSYWGQDDCASMVGGALSIKMAGKAGEVPPVYFLQRAENNDSVIKLEARLRCQDNATGLACALNITDAGEILFFPDHIEIADQPDQHFNLDDCEFHNYTITRDADSLSIAIDGIVRLTTKNLIRVNGRLGVKYPYLQDRISFGTSSRGVGRVPNEFEGSYARWMQSGRDPMIGQSEWQSVSLAIENTNGGDTFWQWDAVSGQFPDQYHRDRVIELMLDPHFDTNGSSWVQLSDGQILCVYYTSRETKQQRPYIEGCLFSLSDFVAPEQLKTISVTSKTGSPAGQAFDSVAP